MIRKVDVADYLLPILEAEARELKTTLSGLINTRLSGLYPAPERPVPRPGTAPVEARYGPGTAPVNSGMRNATRVEETSILSTATEKKEKAKTLHAPEPAGFTEFWSAYPRKEGKGAARKAWLKRRPPLDRVLAAIEEQRQRWDDPQYIPHPSTWLNAERWDDEPGLPFKRNGNGDPRRSAGAHAVTPVSKDILRYVPEPEEGGK